MSKIKWTSPQAHKEAAWFQEVDRIFLGLETGICPVCEFAKLRFFFSRSLIEGRGGFWIWCPHCYTYLHISCRVPDWWEDDERVLNSNLTHNPEWLENHWAELGQE